MHQDKADLLVAALTSGEYKQGNGALRANFNGHEAFCCLGVACDLYAKEHPEAKWMRGPMDGEYRFYVSRGDEHGETAVLPEEVQEWLGVRELKQQYRGDSNCGVKLPAPYAAPSYLCDSLWMMNDGGIDFPTIAEYIRTHAAEL